jgi:hypothetical protein
MRPLLLFATLVGILLGGCATGPQWENRVGHYTYDQAVLELGAPDRDAILSNGMRVVEWVRSPEIYNYPFYSRDYLFTHRSTLESRVPARILRLTFGADGRLTNWKHVRR